MLAWKDRGGESTTGARRGERRPAIGLATDPPSPPPDAVPFARRHPPPADADAPQPPPQKKTRGETGKAAAPAKRARPPPATRFVALQVFYLGWAYRGFSSTSDADNDGTVEVRRGRRGKAGRVVGGGQSVGG